MVQEYIWHLLIFMNHATKCKLHKIRVISIICFLNILNMFAFANTGVRSRTVITANVAGY